MADEKKPREEKIVDAGLFNPKDTFLEVINRFVNTMKEHKSSSIGFVVGNDQGELALEIKFVSFTPHSAFKSIDN